MQHPRHARLLLVAAAAAFAACGDSNSPSVSVISDAQLQSDITTASAEAISLDLSELVSSEVFAGFSAPPASPGLLPGVTVQRTRTCYAANVAQGACDAGTTDSVVLTVQMDGSFERSNTTPHGTEAMSVALHRARTLTISGLAGAETSRTHNGAGSGTDTTAFSGTSDSTSRSRTLTTASTDSVQGIVFNLPHSSNPWPVSGRIIRNMSGKLVRTGPNPVERTFSRRIEVVFPADLQGNVTLKVNSVTCSLNLTTRVVSGCSGTI